MNITEEKLKIYDRILATLSALAIIIGGLWTLCGFIKARDKENLLIEQQMKLDKFNDKKAIYYELCDAESEIAACNSYKEVVIAQKHFRKLYLGRAHILAELDVDVNNQKVNFRELLDKYLEEKPQESPFNYFIDSSLVLADICSKNLNIKSVYK